MPSNYDGSSTGVTPHEQVTIPCPVDADAANAASVNSPLQALANFLQYLSENAALKGAIETARFDGAAGDENASIQSAGAITTRKLVWSLTTPTQKVRFYQASGGALEIVFNAKWRTATSDWLGDSVTFGARAQDVAKVVIGSVGLKVYSPSASVVTGSWADGDWELTNNLAEDGRLKFILTTTGTGGSNPVSTEAVSNELRAKNAPKAWGYVEISDSSVTIHDGFNVKGVSVAAGNGSFKVELATPMADANFAVVLGNDTATLGTPTSGAVAPRINAKSKDGGSGGVAYFGVAWPTVADVSSGNYGFSFVVFGRQDT